MRASWASWGFENLKIWRFKEWSEFTRHHKGSVLGTGGS